ncbi:MAG: hypothetical protein A3F12_03355 [Gammaproteobacteria bacterium RIFCSPHIGHO2_12_FULL_38_14]|nr:MAG: hypothetical protein A3F12_03355 [Gammaproteobacteria bacterium RIFCSPHIGHO2_12_FULL_38_14]
MKQLIFAGLAGLFSIFIMSCQSMQGSGPAVFSTQETWQNNMSMQPEAWKQGADRWFVASGSPNTAEIINRQAPSTQAISTIMVRPSHFTKIKVNGSFQVQIFSGVTHNSVFIYGPNEAARAVMVVMKGNKLEICQAENAPSDMNRVIVRIGVAKLSSLVHMGDGTVEAIYIQPDPLNLKLSGNGSLYLSGQVNLRKVNNCGNGAINVFGVLSPRVKIISSGSGNINLCGKIGVSSITHTGNGNINILGANSDRLTIDSVGGGKIRIKGIVNLCRLNVENGSCVFVQGVLSPKLDVNQSGQSIVGLSGAVKNLHVNTIQTAIFYGQDICAENVYATACDDSHINISASHKAFASVEGNGSIYFYGQPAVLTTFIKDKGVIVPIPRPYRMCYYTPRVSYKDEVVLKRTPKARVAAPYIK